MAPATWKSSSRSRCERKATAYGKAERTRRDSAALHIAPVAGAAAHQPRRGGKDRARARARRQDHQRQAREGEGPPDMVVRHPHAGLAQHHRGLGRRPHRRGAQHADRNPRAAGEGGRRGEEGQSEAASLRRSRPMQLLRQLFLAVLVAVPGVCAAAYPERPITMIIAYPPGGGTDLVGRALAPYLEKYLGGGAKIVVVNRAGAGGEVGFAALANSPTDGYTIGFVNTPPLLTIPIERAAQFTWQRFEYLGNIIDDPCNFSVHTDTNIRNLAELAAYA